MLFSGVMVVVLFSILGRFGETKREILFQIPVLLLILIYKKSKTFEKALVCITNVLFIETDH